MSDTLDLPYLILLIAAPGLGIVGCSSLALMSWVYKPPHQSGVSNEFRLAQASADTTLASLPLMASFLVALFANGSKVSVTMFVVVLCVAIVYSLLYFFVARSRLTKFRLSVHERRLRRTAGA
jgi:hypothetical protein